MKTLALIAAIALTSCADYQYRFALATPYGDVTSAKDGTVTVRPTLTIPINRDK